MIDVEYGGVEARLALLRWIEEMGGRENAAAESARLRARPSTCPSCGEHRARGVPDPCLGWLPGVVHACCGHGVWWRAYVLCAPGHEPNTPCSEIPDDEVVGYRGRVAAEIFDYLRAPPG